MRCLKLHSGAWGRLPRMADDQPIVWERVSWLCTGHCCAQTTGDPVSIVPRSSVSTSAQFEMVLFCALLPVRQRVKES